MNQDIFNHIEIEVCRALHVQPASLRAKNRFFEAKNARWVIWKILRSHGWTYIQLGNMWDQHYDVMSVSNALKKIKDDVNHYQLTRNAYMAVLYFDLQPLEIIGEPTVIGRPRITRELKKQYKSRGLICQ